MVNAPDILERGGVVEIVFGDLDAVYVDDVVGVVEDNRSGCGRRSISMLSKRHGLAWTEKMHALTKLYTYRSL